MKLKTYSLKLISFYQRFLAQLLKTFLNNLGFLRNNSCIFYPTCSEYTKQAIKKYGILKGSFLGFLRILRCHPWQKNHIHPLK